MKGLITVRIVDSVVLGELKISNTVMTVECASIAVSTPTTTANPENTNPIVQSVKNSSLVPEVHRMKCLVDMRFTGSVSDSWLPMIHVVPSVRRRRRLVNA